MNVHSLVLFLHVLAAAVLLGSSLSLRLLQAAVRGAGTVPALLGWLGFARDSARANPAAAFLLLASGVYLAGGRWGEPWLLVGVALFFANSTLAIVVVKATGARLAGLALAAGDGPVGPEIEALRRSPRWAAAAGALIANDVAAMFLMTGQPALLGSVLAVLAANLGALLLLSLRRAAPAGVPGLGGA